MTFTVLLLLLFLIYPVIITGLNIFIKNRIPLTAQRRHIKKKHEFVIRLVYLLFPLLLFHFELFLLAEGHSFAIISLLPLIVLIVLQVVVFLYGIYSMLQFLRIVRENEKGITKDKKQ